MTIGSINYVFGSVEIDHRTIFIYLNLQFPDVSFLNFLKIPHLLELGINAVELLPVFEFDEFELQRHPNPRDHMVTRTFTLSALSFRYLMYYINKQFFYYFKERSIDLFSFVSFFRLSCYVCNVTISTVISLLLIFVNQLNIRIKLC